MTLAEEQTQNSLHSNFYEDWMTEEFVEQGLEQVRELVRRPEPMT